MLTRLKHFLENLFYPKFCLVCDIAGETFFCDSCFEDLFSLTKCLKCGGTIDNFNCKLCSNLFECDRFYIVEDYCSLQKFVYKSKINKEIASHSSFDLSEIIKRGNFKFNQILFVPSRKESHWLHFYLNKEDKDRVFAPLLKNPRKLSQKLLNRHHRIENSVNLFIRSDDFKTNLNSVLLIDDVVSTGNSLQSVIQELIKMGYINISVLMLSYQKLEQSDRR
jgi:predicted amidophosphoribosyltransferase